MKRMRCVIFMKIQNWIVLHHHRPFIFLVEGQTITAKEDTCNLRTIESKQGSIQCCMSGGHHGHSTSSKATRSAQKYQKESIFHLFK